MEYQAKNAVALIVFNRPELTKRVFEQVSKVKPPRLYIIADYPREGNENDIYNNQKVKEIFDEISWPCKVYKNYADKNLGCCVRPYSGISWVFENEESAIILEDDCIPSVEFFVYCDEMLEKYRDDERIMLISGTNYLGTWEKNDNSYFFSSLGGIWGWASWRRVWMQYDVEISKWKDPDIKRLLSNKLTPSIYNHRKQIYDYYVNNSCKLSAWDYQFGFLRFINSGLATVPVQNLITNVGIGKNATHTTGSNVNNLPLGNIPLPIKHPDYVIEDLEYDMLMFNRLVPNKPNKDGLIRKFKNELKKFLFLLNSAKRHN